MATTSLALKRDYVRTVIVDDNPDFLRTLCERIEREPGLIVVATAESGFAALVAVDVLHPDLVLMDVAMPGIGGVEATRRMKARPQPPAVVLVTPHDPADIARAAKDAGADAVISRRELRESTDCVLRALAR